MQSRMVNGKLELFSICSQCGGELQEHCDCTDYCLEKGECELGYADGVTYFTCHCGCDDGCDHSHWEMECWKFKEILLNPTNGLPLIKTLRSH